MVDTYYFANLHDEALALLIKSRRYIEKSRRQAQRITASGHQTNDADRLAESMETTRLTSRLTHLMAWMMAQRAVSTGAISAQEGASERFRLSGKSVCFEHDLEIFDHLPEQLRELLQKSHDLYWRAARLDAQIHGRLVERHPGQAGDHDERRLNSLQLIRITPSAQDPRNAY
jgi:regulator of CtrA degradation